MYTRTHTYTHTHTHTRARALVRHLCVRSVRGQTLISFLSEGKLLEPYKQHDNTRHLEAEQSRPTFYMGEPGDVEPGVRESLYITLRVCCSCVFGFAIYYHNSIMTVLYSSQVENRVNLQTIGIGDIEFVMYIVIYV